VAALDDQLAVSPSGVRHEDVWPLEATEAGQVQGDKEKSSEDKNSDERNRTKAPELANGQDNVSSGKVLHVTRGV
jgi:hypothetical protein